MNIFENIYKWRISFIKRTEKANTKSSKGACLSKMFFGKFVYRSRVTVCSSLQIININIRHKELGRQTGYQSLESGGSQFVYFHT